ncbi:polysaccharide biosynthesis protein [Bordetella petrii]|nr:polysaccharide biosynthesis protein [Bordetella petrii]
MKLIFHVGMGKTGSSAIQAALAANAERLAAQKAEYLGMWFDMIDPRFHGLKNQDLFFTQSQSEMETTAETLVAVLKARSADRGIETFILSNEALSGRAHVLKPMIDKLMAEDINVQVVGYARNPAAWLPSAHIQWSVRDKVEAGPIKPYGARARKLVGWYSGLISWGKVFGNIVDIRPYDRAADIVADFSEAIGTKLDTSGARVLERGEDAEVLLRALFNNRFNDHTLPQVFDRTVLRTTATIPRMEELARKCFDYSETDKILAENAQLFDRFTSQFGFDPRNEGDTRLAMPDMPTLRNRVFDCLVEIVLNQAQRIQRLERRITSLEASSRATSD